MELIHLLNNLIIKIKHIANFKREILCSLFLLLFCLHKSFSQEISKSLDSILSLSGKNVDKLELYNELLNRHKKNKDYKQLGDDAHELAKRIYKEDINKAIFYNQMAIEAKSKVNPLDSCSLKTSYYNVGFYNKRKKDYEHAIEGYKKALKFPDCKSFNRKSRKSIAYCYLKTANKYHTKEDYFSAVSNYKNAIGFIDEGDLKSKIFAHQNLGKAYKSLRSKEAGEKAIENFLKVESLSRKLPGFNEEDNFGIYYTIAGQYYQNGDELNKSLFYYNKALKLIDKVSNEEDIKNLYFNLGYTYQKLDYNKAKEYYAKSLEIGSKKDDFNKSIYFGLGENESLNKQYKLAQKHFLKSLSYFFNESFVEEPDFISVEKLVKVEDKNFLLEVFRTQMENWDRMMLENSDNTIPKLIINKAKQCDQLVDIMLKDDLSYNSKLLLRDLVSEIYILALEACYRVNDVDNAFYFIEKNKALLLIGDLRKEKISTKDSTSIRSNYFLNPELSKILTLDEINVSDNEVVLNYVMAERLAGKLPNAYGLFISKENKKLFKIKETKKLIEDVTKLRNKLDKPFETSNDKKEYFHIANSVYNLLIPFSVQTEIIGKKITVLGDHVINFIPFEALLPNKDKEEYLVELNEINYDYSLTFREENANIKFNASKNFLGVAPVNFSDKLVSLKDTDKEIELGENLYSGKLLIGEKASVENFKKEASNYKILHLATHANASDTINPWIAFRNSKLKLSQFDSIKTKANLVVLSACNTSLGKISRGEGVMSLARGFFASGAKTVIPSLWEVNDKSTTNITSDFYRYLSEGSTKSEALHKAKLLYLKNNSDAEASPYYWASLIIIGENSVLKPQFQVSFYLKLGLGILVVLILFFLFKRY